MANRIRYGKGRASVWLEGALAENIEFELRRALGPVYDELEKAADQVLVDARKAWPVRTGDSRDGFFTTLTIHGHGWELTVSIMNRYEYTRYIRSTKLGKRRDATRIRSPSSVHVVRPSRKAARRLAKHVLPGLLKSILEREVLDG